MLAGFTIAYVRAIAREGPISVWDVVPLHLCDFAILVAVFALATLHSGACELLYFWGGTGTLLAMLTPDLRQGWPDWRFIVYFGLHGDRGRGRRRRRLRPRTAAPRRRRRGGPSS